MKTESEGITHGFKEAKESAAGVNNNKTAKANFEKEVVHKAHSKGRGSDVGDWFVDNEASEVAHSGEDVRRTGGGIRNTARGPEVDVKNEERSADRPREKEFAVTADVRIGRDTVGARFAPFVDVGAHVGPKEAQAETVKRLEFTKMPGGGRGVVCGKDCAAEGFWNDDKHKLAVVGFKALVNDEAVVDDGAGVGAKVCAVLRVDSEEVGFLPLTRRLRGEAVIDELGVRVGLVSRGPVGGSGKRLRAIRQTMDHTFGGKRRGGGRRGWPMFVEAAGEGRSGGEGEVG